MYIPRNRNAYKFATEDWENLTDLLLILESDFNFTLSDTDLELKSVSNFDDLCFLIITKINLEEDHFCTSQLAFYQIRNSLLSLGLKYEDIAANTKLEDIFPRNNRRSMVKSLILISGLKYNFLQPKLYLVVGLLFMLILSVVGLFIKPLIALASVFIIVYAIVLVGKYGKELGCNTIRELIECSVVDSYFTLRGNKQSMNKTEFKGLLMRWFSVNLSIEESCLKTVEFN